MFYNALTLETPPLLVIVPDDAGAGELSTGANLISGLARLTGRFTDPLAGLQRAVGEQIRQRQIWR